ncbi:alpha/beta hydrolase [Streptomyces sp. NBC_00847]|nr:alpha/beta hydrolase [Streptomyces sp. NBC_00847]MCX4881061.1 alpha/beta hydrolase [Streptomyces sp. NBC_00847]
MVGRPSPTLLVQGENGTMRASEPADMLAGRPSPAHHTVVPDAGHDVHLDQPEHLYEAIAAFLRTPESRPADPPAAEGRQ